MYRWINVSLLALAVVLSTVVTLPVHSTATTSTLIITSDTTLTEDHYGDIIIGADDITLDCAGFSVIGSGSGYGIFLLERSGVHIRNCLVRDFVAGFAVIVSYDNTLNANTAEGDGTGFHFVRSSNNVLTRNTASGNNINGFQLWSSSDNILTMNTANGNVMGDGFIFFGDSFNNILVRNTANGNGRAGFNLEPDFNGNTLTANTADGNAQYGFVLTSSNDNNLRANAACGNGVVDAFQSDCTGNVFVANRFCTTLGI